MIYFFLLPLLGYLIIYSVSKELRCCCCKKPKLKVKKVKNLEPHYANDCPICLGELITESSSLLNNNNEVVCLDICNNENHPFHRGCIIESLKNYGMKCPVCRATNLNTEGTTTTHITVNSYGSIEEV